MFEGTLVGAALGVFPEPLVDVALALVEEVEVVAPEAITSGVGVLVGWFVVSEGTCVGVAFVIFPELSADGAMVLVVVVEAEVFIPVVGILVG